MNTNLRTRGTYQRPSELMLQWLETEGSRDWIPLLDALSAGTHVANPYHNMTHMLNVAWHARHIYRTEVAQQGWLPHKEAVVVVSALLHDFDHSGGAFHNDLHNIGAALGFIDSLAGVELLTTLDLKSDIETIKNNIRCTRYDSATNSFPVPPEDTMQRALRDADLMSLYSQEGRQLLVGLYYEVYGKPFVFASLDEAKAYARAQYEFNITVPMYTRYGQRMQAQQFVRSIRDLLSTLGSSNYALAVSRVRDVIPEVAIDVSPEDDSRLETLGQMHTSGTTLQ